ncbi:HAD superfamily hydrolase (TIGR01484 family) [Halopolyspora algeriensis]|uniref:HAD superfamily hydrolase (TIGR01484 family) n=2 Tax=Halopolyspora algeriensis TaxID=1500506 RepID=A0A368W508_9ACTN|nr:HAD superfamily hydrolase (TIGR01484 family) [Halopolyspora algeriensis]TQM48217.1 HAD superfamily hydrolase (TIGR01484 family) [Halopolyspora algeriensis]
MHRPRLVALDVDGTVLDPETQTVSTGVREAVRRVVDAGGHVIVATGRSMLGTLPILDELGLHSGAALCSNGAVRVDAATRETVAVETFDPAPVHERLSALLPGSNFAAEQVGTGSLVTGWFPEALLHGPQRPADVDELVGRRVPRLIAHWAGHTPDEATEVLAGVHLPTCTYTIDHYAAWVTVVPEGVTKGAALEKLRTELGVAVEDTFAAGDGDNDIQMLEWAGHSVAMGQAPDPVRAAAAEVTDTVAEDGLVMALDRWLRLSRP